MIAYPGHSTIHYQSKLERLSQSVASTPIKQVTNALAYNVTKLIMAVKVL
jgi:hypothetical protein